MNTTSPRSTVLSLLAFGLWASAAGAQCTTATFYADLRTGAVVNEDPALYHVISAMDDSDLADCAGWREAVVRVDIPKDCTTATVSAEYEGTPVAWTLNIGDSPTNNGYAGDAGTTVHNAELWILNDTMALANAGGSPSDIDNPLLYKILPLTDGAIRFLVRDQFVSWGQPYEYIQSPNNKLLFAIPDDTMKEEASSIYVGLNRVISGAPGNGRTGCGLRSALIRLQ